MKDNVDIFKGPKGDTGEQGPAGQDGKDGKNGINGIDGINGNPGPQGPPGRDGKDGVDGQDGSDGKSFDFESLTEEQKLRLHLSYLTLVIGNNIDSQIVTELENGLALWLNL